MGKLGSNPLAGLAALGLGGLAAPANTGGLNPAGKLKIKINRRYKINKLIQVLLINYQH